MAKKQKMIAYWEGKTIVIKHPDKRTLLAEISPIKIKFFGAVEITPRFDVKFPNL